MTRLKQFGQFWYDFVIGDDWRIAVLVAVALAVTAALAHNGHPGVWWLMPAVVAAALAASLWSASKPPAD